jgi:hypothetical protein
MIREIRGRNFGHKKAGKNYAPLKPRFGAALLILDNESIKLFQNGGIGEKFCVFFSLSGRSRIEIGFVVCRMFNMVLFPQNLPLTRTFNERTLTI